jgi:uncharacterized membrane protein YqjE
MADPGMGSPDGRRGIGSLLRDLAEGGTVLVRREVQLARIEIAEIGRNIGTGTAMFAAGGVLALLGLLSLLVGVILLIGDQWLPRDLYWLAALIVMLVTGGLAAWLAMRGKALLAPSQLAPDQTIATLKEDKEWMKHQLTSGATSR